MRAAGLLLVRAALAGGVLLTAGAGAGRRVAAQTAAAPGRPVVRVDHAGRRLSALPPAPAVPPGAADVATAWLATTYPQLSVLFSYHREEVGCPARCEQYGLWLHYEAPSGGAAKASPAWQQISQAECADFWADGGKDLTCVSSVGMAGRDRRGNDYVLRQMYASRDQLQRMLGSRTLVFALGGVTFHLVPAGRDSLRRFLALAGRVAGR